MPLKLQALHTKKVKESKRKDWKVTNFGGRFLARLAHVQRLYCFQLKRKKREAANWKKRKAEMQNPSCKIFCRVLKVKAWWGERQTTGSIYTRVNERFRVLVCLLVYVILTWRRASFCLFSVGSSAPLITHWRLAFDCGDGLKSEKIIHI